MFRCRGAQGTARGLSWCDDAMYANIAVNVALLRRSSGTILSYVSRLVCHARQREQHASAEELQHFYVAQGHS